MSVSKYVTEKKEFTDEDIDEILTRYMKIKDRDALDKLRGIFNDYYDTLKMAKEKSLDDDKRHLTKAEAQSIVDNTLAHKYGQYLNTFLYIKWDNKRSFRMVFGVTVLSVMLATSGLALLLGLPLLTAGWLTVTNISAAYRDLRRTRLVIVKEIEKLDNTIVRLEAEENPDKEKISQLKEVKKLLILQSGYSKNDKKWKEVTKKRVYERITDMYESYGDLSLVSEDVLNFLEAETEDALNKEDTPEEEPVDNNTNEENPEGEEENVDSVDATQDNPEDGEKSDYFGDALGSKFGDSDNAKEEEYKIEYCREQLSILFNKFTRIYDDILVSDTYRSIANNPENPLAVVLAQHTLELKNALVNLEEYNETGDFTMYSAIAIKLSSFKTTFNFIDKNIGDILNENTEDMDS